MASESAQSVDRVPPIEIIVAQMAQARTGNDANLRPFAVTREYRLFTGETKTEKSQVTAEIFFTPPDLKSYAIRQTSGAGLGERVVRRILASEAEIAKDDLSTDFSSRNYAFHFVRIESIAGRHCYRIELLPRRKDKSLIRGDIWIDAETYLPLRTEGELAQNPSWWVKEVHLILSYGEVGGMWLQTSLEATASIRILGDYSLTSRDMKYQLQNHSSIVQLMNPVRQPYTR